MRFAPTFLLLALGAALPAPPAAAHPHHPVASPVPEGGQEQQRGPTDIETPPLADAVARLLDRPYLTDDERADARVFHGVWEEADLEDPARRARAALIVGAFDDQSLTSDAAAPEDRAEAAIHRGEMSVALDLLAGVGTLRAHRLRAEALEWLGRLDEADAAIDPVVAALTRRQTQSADELVEAVRALNIRARLRGQPAGDFQRMMALLARARDELDRLHWPARLAEARLLYEKDNRKEAVEAIGEVLRLSPACAEAWALRARIAVDSFNFELARAIAGRLDRLERPFRDDPEGSHPFGDLALTRAWLRQKEGSLAGEQLAPTIQRYPAMREAMALDCAVAAARFDLEQTERLLDRFDEASPRHPLALLRVGETLSEMRQYEQAADYLERAAARRENWPPPLIELGLMELQFGRDARAADVLRRVAELDPFNTRARNSLALIEELLTYDTVESEHFIVRFRPGEDRVLAIDMLPMLESMHEQIAGAFDWEPDRKTVIELMPDHEWFAVRITGMPRIWTIAAATGPVIAMEAPKFGPNHSGEYDWVRVIRHEYTHTITLGRTNNRISHWFTEAAAQAMEGSVRSYRTCQLLASALLSDELFDLREINIAFVRPKKPTDRSQAYAQALWMYEFIVETFGEDTPIELMDLAREGLPESEALPSVLGITEDAFFERFRAWARAELFEWGMLVSPTIDELRLEQAAQSEEGRARLLQGLAPYAHATGIGLAGAHATAPDWSLPAPSPTRDDVAAWLEEHPDHPELLDRMIAFDLAETEGEPAPELAPLLERYAAARPVDPTPHRLLVRLYLDQDTPEAREAMVPHLAYLNAREQKASTYATELARSLSRLGRWENASDYAEQATQRAPYDAGLRELAATAAIKTRDLDTARRHIAALTLLEPQRDLHKKRLEALDRMRSGRADEEG